VTCSHAEVDLRVGGRYRIVNLLPDGMRVTIEGVFREIARPNRLVYSWRIDDGPDRESLVTVRFEPQGEATEIVIVHAQIADEPTRRSHESGWYGCLDSLISFVEVEV
jgi:uncharacterized protein YndB with AHSA1/START domain